MYPCTVPPHIWEVDTQGEREPSSSAAIAVRHPFINSLLGGSTSKRAKTTKSKSKRAKTTEEPAAKAEDDDDQEDDEAEDPAEEPLRAIPVAVAEAMGSASGSAGSPGGGKLKRPAASPAAKVKAKAKAKPISRKPAGARMKRPAAHAEEDEEEAEDEEPAQEGEDKEPTQEAEDEEEAEDPAEEADESSPEVIEVDEGAEEGAPPEEAEGSEDAEGLDAEDAEEAEGGSEEPPALDHMEDGWAEFTSVDDGQRYQVIVKRRGGEPYSTIQFRLAHQTPVKRWAQLVQLGDNDKKLTDAVMERIGMDTKPKGSMHIMRLTFVDIVGNQSVSKPDAQRVRDQFLHDLAN